MRRLFTMAEDAYLVAHYATETIRQMAAGLDRKWQVVQQRISLLIKAGRLDRNDRHYHHPWTEDDDDWLSEHWGVLPDADVAALLRRTVEACSLRAERHVGIARQQNIWTAAETARLFGVDPSTVVTWIDRGWLDGQPSAVRCGGGRGRMWSVDPDSIERFIADRPWCYRWQRMPESYHRNLAERVWRADPYVTLAEVARELNWQQPRVDRWLKRGFLPFVRRSKIGTQHGPWQGEIVVRRSDLAAFVERVAAAVHENRSRASRKRTLRQGGWGRRRRQEVAA